MLEKISLAMVEMTEAYGVGHCIVAGYEEGLDTK